MKGFPSLLSAPCLTLFAPLRTVGGAYDFTDSVYTTAMLTYSDFDSDEDYVFGDGSGEAYYGYVGVGVRF